MKRMLSVMLVVGLTAGSAGVSLAHGPGGWAGARRSGMMGMGPGMDRGPGPAACPGWDGAAMAECVVTEEKAKTLAQEYADTYLPGFTVDKILPFTHPHRTMYAVELKGPQDEVRVLHINAFGAVMPFGGPWRRGA